MTKEPSQCQLIHDTLGYSPGSVPAHPANKVTQISRTKLRAAYDAAALEELNRHPLMIARGHVIELVP